MLQIISGRFFNSKDRYVNDGKGILYSNYSWIAPIVTCVGTIEPVRYHGAAKPYVFSYKNQIEKGPPGAGGLVRTGDDEIVRQFQLLCILGLRAYFADDRANILTNCRTRPVSSSDQILPSAFVDRLFDAEVRGTTEDAASFASLVESVITLPRREYSAVIGVLDNLDHALQVMNWNLDLAYSMMVYCLESLAQSFDAYVPRWDDYEDAIRLKLDGILDGLGGETVESVRQTLLEGSHLKLSARFLDFVTAYVGDSFFTSEAAGRERPLPRSHLRRALRNAYRLRSGYVHRLERIREQLHHPALSEGDMLTWDGEPYLTLRGLTRLVFHVVRSFIDRQPHTATEELAWRSELPGTLRVEVSPEYWIWKHEYLTRALGREQISKEICSKLGGFLTHLVQLAQTGKGLVDLRGLLERYGELEGSVPEIDRLRMRTTRFLFESLLRGMVSDEERSAWTARGCWIETMVADLLLFEELPRPYEECRRAYDDFAVRRFSYAAVKIPQVLEIKLLAALANKALDAGHTDDFAGLAQMALLEAAGMADLQNRLGDHLKARTPIDHQAIFTLRRMQDSPPAPHRGSSVF